jgi:hypothetical protein
VASLGKPNRRNLAMSIPATALRHGSPGAFITGADLCCAHMRARACAATCACRSESKCFQPVTGYRGRMRKCRKAPSLPPRFTTREESRLERLIRTSSWSIARARARDRPLFPH